MPSFRTYLQVNGRQYALNHFDFELHQETDVLGRPASLTYGGVFVLTTEAPPAEDATLYRWMADPARHMNAQVLIKDMIGSTLKVIKLYNAYCVGLTEHFSPSSAPGAGAGIGSLFVTIRLSPQAVNNGGVFHDNDWPGADPIVDWEWADMAQPPAPRAKAQPKAEEPSALSEAVHTVLDVVGMIPLVGELADGANALLYAAEGDYANAALSAASMVPLAGNVVGAAKLGKRVLKVADKVSDAVKGPVKKLLKTCGDPVDVASGAVLAEAVDFTLPGPIPLAWERTWFSTSSYQGPLGYGWSHTYDWSIAAIGDDGSVGVRDGEGRLVAFEAPTPGGKGVQTERLALFLDQTGRYRIWHMDELRWYNFSPSEAGYPLPLQSIEDPNGFAIRFAYNEANHLQTITDSAGRVLRVDTDPSRRILAIYSPETAEMDSFTLVRYEYDLAGNLVAAIDAGEHRMGYHYAGHQLIRRTSRTGVNWHFRYESSEAGARCIRTWGDRDLLSYTLRYDSDSQTTVWDSYDHPTIYTHKDGLVIHQVDALGGEQSWTYSESGQLLTEQDALGHITRYEYDEWGRQVSITMPDDSSQFMRYDDRGLLASATNATGGEWHWQYDLRGNLLQQTDPAGVTTRYEYDEEGHLVTVINALEQSTHVRYNKQHQVAHVITPDEAIRSRSYDGLGRLISITDTDGSVQRRQYDRLNQLVKIEEADGTHQRFQYDPSGNIIKAWQGDQRIEFDYTGLGQLRERRQADQQLQFSYDKEGRLIELFNEAGLRYRFGLNALGQVIEEEGFDGLLRRYERDPMGRVSKVIRPAGQSTEYKYDVGGQVSEICYSDGSYETYTYDKAGALVTATNSTTTVLLDRDYLSRVVRESQGDHWIAYTYNILGQRIGLTSSLGADVTLSHDAMGNVAQMQMGNWQARFDYDNRGLEVQRQLSGGLRVDWQRDTLGRPTTQRIATGQLGSIRQRTYQWTGTNALTQIVDSQTGVSRFEHDLFGSLIKAIYNDGSQELRLPDAVGNLFETGDRQDRQYGAAGQLLRSQEAHYSYDEEGNLVEKITRKGEVWRYRWSDSGMLQEVIRPDGQPVLFAYDALGRRISKSYKGKITRWVWEGNKPLHEWQELALSGQNTDDVITWLFEEDSFAPVAKLQGHFRQSILTDHLGTPLEMVDQSGQRTWSAQLTSYGRIRLEQGTRAECPFRFPGQYEDVETGLYYNRFRYYDSKEGLYISQDPIQLAGGNRFYGYVRDPYVLIDPSGLNCEITAKLQKHANDAKIEAVLSPKQQASIARSNRRAIEATDPKVKAYHEMQAAKKERLYMGTQVDTRFKAKVDADPDLAHLSTTPRGKVGPDVYDPKAKKYWDLTTKKDWDKGTHQDKYDADFGVGTGIFW